MMTPIPSRTLLGPGPSPVSDRVREAMAQPVVGHLDPWFVAQLDDLSRLLREVFRTTNELTFAVSGTGSAAMEAAVVNAVEPGDKIVVAVNGIFGERIAEIALRAGADVVRVTAPWGAIVDLGKIEKVLRTHSDAAAFAIVHAETSTGVNQPIAGIGQILSGTETLFIADAVTSLAGVELLVDEWGIDICYSGSQKCLSVPPGLGPITFSDKAVEKLKKRKTQPRSWYLDATLIGKYWGEERVYHHTAPISMIYGLLEGLRVVKEEGLEKRWALHKQVGERLHHELIDRGFNLFAAEGYRLPQLTAALVPDKLQGSAPRKALLEDFGIEVGAGLGEMADRMWRIGLMGEGAKHENVDQLLNAIDKLLA